MRHRRHRRGLARQGDALCQVRARGPDVPADIDLSPDDRRRLCGHGYRQPVERVRHGAPARLRRGDGEPLGGRRDAASDPQRRGPLRAADRGGAAERAEARGRALREGGLAPGGGAGNGVLPHQAEPQPQRADRAAGGADRAADGEPPSLFHERRRRVRQGDRRHLRLRRGAGVRDRHDHPGGRRRSGGDQLPARRPGGARRPGLLLQAHDPRGGAQEQLLRHLHGQADAGRARAAPCTSTSRWWT